MGKFIACQIRFNIPYLVQESDFLDREMSGIKQLIDSS